MALSPVAGGGRQGVKSQQGWRRPDHTRWVWSACAADVQGRGKGEPPQHRSRDPLLRKQSSKWSTKGLPPAACPLQPHPRCWLPPEDGWSLPGLSGCHPGPLEWPEESRTHPGLLLFSLELRINLLGARVLPGPAFVASLSPCTRTGSLGRQQEGS